LSFSGLTGESIGFKFLSFSGLTGESIGFIRLIFSKGFGGIAQ
jgi:hypothetical protein